MSLSTRLSFVLTTLLILVLSADPGQAAGRVAVRPAPCRACEIAKSRCSVNCFGREDKNDMRSCLVGCDNAAALCTCDEPVTLNSEDYVARFGSPEVTGLKDACHATTTCGPSYGSCAGWSSVAPCGGVFCGFVPGCGLCNEWGQCETGGQGEVENLERYRVCFNDQGEPCTEYQRSVSYGACGC